MKKKCTNDAWLELRCVHNSQLQGSQTYDYWTIAAYKEATKYEKMEIAFMHIHRVYDVSNDSYSLHTNNDTIDELKSEKWEKRASKKNALNYE